MNEIIKASGLVYKYDTEEEVAALDNVNLSINKGEFVVIIGHNGSGKSTLAKHLNALLRPTGGTVIIKGMDTRDPNLTWEIRQTAGMVFQNPDNQLVATVVEEDVAFGPENLGMPPEVIRERVDEALRIVNMSEYSSFAPHLLSGGQKQRVAIAGIIAMRPECIILDEPTAMLDPVGRKEVMDTIKKLNKTERITIIHITHFMEEAVDADRVYVMESGKVVLQGKPKEVFKQVERIKQLGLDVPQITELAYRLNKEGFDIPPDILTVEEMVDVLCP
ncbi:MAG TPA: energy-coupling factor transporter ATPase [Clostridiales bacterium]|nr:energy-coupling factor transporter ATPase [Clostridiales bacterium]